MLDLPNELVTLIAEFLDDEYCINALLQTCRRFFLLLNSSLYEHNVRYSYACSLEWAAQKGHEATAQYALEGGASPNAVHNEEWVPMALACIHGHEAIVRLLLDHGVDPNSTEGWLHTEDPFSEPEGDDDGCPMILAAGRGHEDVIRLLLSYGASPDVRCIRFDGLEITPLAIAARQGYLSIVKLFVQLGCDVHIPGWWGSTILADAAYGGHSGVVRFLLETNPDIESPHMDRFPALSEAASQGHLEIVDLLLEHWMSRTPRMEVPITPLVRATQGEHYAVIERLQRSMDLEGFIAGREPDDDDDDDVHKQLFLVSAACGWGDLIEKLLERGCSTDFTRPKTMLWGIKVKHPEPGLNSRLGDPSPLALAAHRGHHGVVELLLNRNADLHGHKKPAKEREANSLFLAIDGIHKRIVNTLLDHGADPSYRINDTEPVLFKAVQTPEILQLLLDRGADPEIYAENRESVLIRAMKTGSLAAVYILQRKIPFEEPPRIEGISPTSFLEAGALGGASMIEHLIPSQ